MAGSKGFTLAVLGAVMATARAGSPDRIAVQALGGPVPGQLPAPSGLAAVGSGPGGEAGHGNGALRFTALPTSLIGLSGAQRVWRDAAAFLKPAHLALRVIQPG